MVSSSARQRSRDRDGRLAEIRRRLDAFWPSVGGLFFALLSVFILTFAMRHLPAGTAYAIWTGIGAIGIATLGIVLFGDPATPLRLGCIALIIVGVVGLRLVEG